MKKSTLLFSLTLLSTTASTYDVWIVPGGNGNDYQLVYGHPGELENYDPSKVEGGFYPTSTDA